MRKKGVELSMNVIIIAAIALIVLVILVLLVTNAGGNVKDGTGCTAARGQCTDLIQGESCSDVFGEGHTSYLNNDCPEQQVCCYQPFEG